MERPVRLRSFATSSLGRVVLIAVAIGTLTGSFLYLGPFLAIATFLLFGLAVPIYLGWKIPKQLALAGLVGLLVSAPLASLAETQTLRTPSPVASSSPNAPYGNGGSVLTNAVVNPFSGAQGGTYAFTATVNPQYLPKATSNLVWVELFVTTCPGATGNNSPFCSAGYPFFSQNHSFSTAPATPFPISFQVALPGANIWWWQMAAVGKNTTNNNLTWVFLDTSNGYSSVQGPVTGDFLATLALVIPAIYLTVFFYPGLIFFVALLVYAFFKSREARRKAQAQGPLPPTSGVTPAPTSSAPPGKPAPAEKACPNCGAVVYPSETKCWKCGVTLTGATPPSAPLPSAPK